MRFSVKKIIQELNWSDEVNSREEYEYLVTLDITLLPVPWDEPGETP